MWCDNRFGICLGLPDHFKFFQGYFVFQRDMVGYFHTCVGVRNGSETGIYTPGNWIKNQKFLENLKSASWFRWIDLILVTFMALTLHKSQLHCSGVMQWWACSPLMSTPSSGDSNVTKLASALSYCYRCCVTITRQPIFKGSLQVTIVNALFRMWLLTSDIFDRWCSDTVTQWRSQPKNFWRTKFWGGTKCLVLGEQQYFLWDTASQSAKWLLVQKFRGAWPPSYACAVTADNGKTRCFMLWEKKHECYGKKYLFIWLVGQDTFPHLATSEMPTWVRPWM